MSGSRNFHERGSNENGNFWSQPRGGPTPQKSRNYLFLGKIFKFQGGGGGPDPRSPPLDPRMQWSYKRSPETYTNKRTNGPVNAHLRAASYTNTILKADESLGSIFFRIIKFQSYCPFPARLSLKMTF